MSTAGEREFRCERQELPQQSTMLGLGVQKKCRNPLECLFCWKGALDTRIFPGRSTCWTVRGDPRSCRPPGRGRTARPGRGGSAFPPPFCSTGASTHRQMPPALGRGIVPQSPDPGAGFFWKRPHRHTCGNVLPTARASAGRQVREPAAASRLQGRASGFIPKDLEELTGPSPGPPGSPPFGSPVIFSAFLNIRPYDLDIRP